jgi:hypothetical protein
VRCGLEQFDFLRRDGVAGGVRSDAQRGSVHVALLVRYVAVVDLVDDITNQVSELINRVLE